MAEVEGAAYAEVEACPWVLLCHPELFRPPWPLTWKSLEIMPLRPPHSQSDLCTPAKASNHLLRPL